MQQERPNISELEAQLAITEERLKKFLKQQIELKSKLKEMLENPDLSVEDETKIKESLQIIQNNMQKVQMEGLL